MSQSEQVTQPLQWMVERRQRLNRQRRNDFIVDAAFLALMLIAGAALVLILGVR